MNAFLEARAELMQAYPVSRSCSDTANPHEIADVPARSCNFAERPGGAILPITFWCEVAQPQISSGRKQKNIN